MKIVITGSKGQLGRALQEVLTDDELFPIDLPELDLISHQNTLDYITSIRPDLVIHCAAKTQVDECELDSLSAYRSNVLATKNVVNACQVVNSALVYISTDYVFDGEGNRPYLEYDPTSPRSVYGKTKWQAEMIVQMHLQRFYIARTAWLFGDVGGNFVRTMLKLAGERDLLKVVDDQIGCPTYALDLAEAIHKLIRTEAYGIYHVVNEGHCSWFEFTKQILELANREEVEVEPITTEQINRPAPRPRYSVLATEALNSLGIRMPGYQDALKRFFIKNISKTIINKE